MSKQEGGNWGLDNLPEKYYDLILQALDEYSSDRSMKWNENATGDYAAYMLDQIRNEGE